jgi:hypothetical protein
MRVLSAITDPEVARRILDSLRMPSRAPPLTAPRPGVEERFEALAAELAGVDDPGFDFDQSEPEPVQE